MTEEIFGYRRTTPRIACALPARCKEYGSGPHSFECMDISSRGAKVRLSHPLGKHTHITLQVETEKNPCLHLQGRVRWCSKCAAGYQAGIVFDRELSAHPKQFL